jgi:hypothetical protein
MVEFPEVDRSRIEMMVDGHWTSAAKLSHQEWKIKDAHKVAERLKRADRRNSKRRTVRQANDRAQNLELLE